MQGSIFSVIGCSHASWTRVNLSSLLPSCCLIHIHACIRTQAPAGHWSPGNWLHQEGWRRRLVNYSNKQDHSYHPCGVNLPKKVIPFATKIMFIYVHSSLMSCVTTEMVILPLISKLLCRKTVGEENKQVVKGGNIRVGWWLVFNAIPNIQQLNRL